MNARDVPTPAAPDPGAPLFFYGTLRRGGGSERLLTNCQFLRRARAVGSLFDFGAFPGLVLDGGGQVDGEIWMCPGETLLLLDTYEGVREGLFARVCVRADDTECWTYVVGPALWEWIGPESRIESGHWTPGHGAPTPRDAS